MPGGLPEVTQAVGADTQRYIEAYRKAREETVKLIGANDDFIRKIGEVQAALKALPDRKTVRIDVEAGAALAEIAKVRAALDGLGDKNITIGDNGAMVRELRDI